MNNFGVLRRKGSGGPFIIEFARDVSSLRTERFNSELKRWVMSWSAGINIKRLSRLIIVIAVRLAGGFMRVRPLVRANNTSYPCANTANIYRMPLSRDSNKIILK